MFHSYYEGNWCSGFIPVIFQAFLIQGGSHKPSTASATVNQHTPVHQPLDACYYSVVDEPQLS